MIPLWVDWGAAFVGGVVGTLAITAFWYAVRAAGWMALDWGMLLGTFFAPPTRRALSIGLSWHGIAGLVLGLIYAPILIHLDVAPTVGSGALLGVLHGIVMLAVLYGIGRLHPLLLHRMPTRIWSGRDLALFWIGYPIYGAFFGGSYASYSHWSSAEGMNPAAFWSTAGVVVGVLLVIGLASYRLLMTPEAGHETSFAATEPDRFERLAWLRGEFDDGRLTLEEYEREVLDLFGRGGRV